MPKDNWDDYPAIERTALVAIEGFSAAALRDLGRLPDGVAPETHHARLEEIRKDLCAALIYIDGALGLGDERG